MFSSKKTATKATPVPVEPPDLTSDPTYAASCARRENIARKLDAARTRLSKVDDEIAAQTAKRNESLDRQVKAVAAGEPGDDELFRGVEAGVAIAHESATAVAVLKGEQGKLLDVIEVYERALTVASTETDSLVSETLIRLSKQYAADVVYPLCEQMEQPLDEAYRLLGLAVAAMDKGVQQLGCGYPKHTVLTAAHKELGRLLLKYREDTYATVSAQIIAEGERREWDAAAAEAARKDWLSGGRGPGHPGRGDMHEPTRINR